MEKSIDGHGACPPCPSLPPPQDGVTALWTACSSGHTEAARLLLEAGADKEAADQVRPTAHVHAAKPHHAPHCAHGPMCPLQNKPG